MPRVKTTLSLDDRLMRIVRARAARSGRSQSDVVEEALKEGLSIVDRLRANAGLEEEEALQLASNVVHDVRASRTKRTSAKRKA